MKERTAERSAACSTCGKTFARSDTLLRHEKSHLATEDRGPVHRVTNATFRACCACAQARSRCSGGDPCGRCKMRNLECTYPNKRRKVVTTVDGEDIMDEKVNIQFDRSDSKVDHSTTQRQYVPPFQELVFTHTADSSYPGSGQLTLAPTESVPVSSYQVIASPPQPELQRGGLEYGSDVRQPIAGMIQHGPMHATTNTVSAASDQMSRPNPYSTIAQPSYQPTYSAQSTQYGFGDNYDDPMNLNWIPLSFYPSPYGDMEQDFSFLLPSLSETASMGTNYNPVPFDTSVPQILHGHGADTYIPSIVSEHPTHASLLGVGQSPNSSVSEGAPMIRSMQEGVMTGTKSKRRKFSHVQNSFVKMRMARKDFEFPDISERLPSNYGSTADICSDAQYTAIRSTFERLCLDSSSSRAIFRSTRLPDRAMINHCISLYFECFQPNFPLIHSSSIDENTNWLLLLAIAAVGSNFVSVPTCIELREAFQELLRRATCESEIDEFNDMSFVQSRILNLVCVVQADRPQSKSLAPRYHAELSRWCLESGLLQIITPDEEHDPKISSDAKETAWRVWIKQESERRIGYFIWLLDCALGYLCNARPLCNMDDARTPLPCTEKLWDATTAEKWFEYKLSTPTMPSLCTALEAMYTAKRVNPNMSGISNILLVHALYSRTWEVGTHIKQPLSEWKATGTSRGFLNTPSKDNFWLPLYPLYANWRNSACDCLDILHWQASSVIADAAGSEHHEVLHLHLARIILLTPFQEIQDLLFFLINHNVGEESRATFYVHDGSYQRRHAAKLAQIRNITSRWLREDQHKARLAMIHAGSVFWHVRRYSSNSFFDPLAIYLASIVLWTYGSYKSAALEREAADANDHYQIASRRQSLDMNVQPTRVELASRSYASSNRKSATSSHSPKEAANLQYSSPVAAPYSRIPNNASHHSNMTPTSNPASQSSPVSAPLPISNRNEDENEHDSDSDRSSTQSQDQPSFIHLDRPCDDEIVQHFVRNGHNMAGYMSNVGDICQTPTKVLVEGAKLLRTKLGCWGISREFHDVLVKLAERGKGSGGGSKNRKGKQKENGGFGVGVDADEER